MGGEAAVRNRFGNKLPSDQHTLLPEVCHHGTEQRGYYRVGNPYIR